MAKRIPGIPTLYRQLFQIDTSRTWLYRPETLAWMKDPDIRDQLPLAHRAFALYCRAQSFTTLPILLGPLVFGIIRRARFRRASAIRMEVRGRAILLDPCDPRMLRVPGELIQLINSDGLLSRLLSEGDTFIDVGANHGAFSVAASAYIGASGTIVAFEPQTRLADLIRSSLRQNGMSEFVVYSSACSDSAGEADLFVPIRSSGAAGLHPRFSGISKHSIFRVPLVRLDEVLGRHFLPGSVVVKMDVEGNEVAALRGASEFIRERRPTILLEVNPEALKAAGTSVDSLRDLLAELGCHRYRPADQIDQMLPLDSLDMDQHQNIVVEFD